MTSKYHSKKIAILIPCHNEEQSVRQVVEGFRSQFPQALIYVYDNASTDNTAAVAERAGAIVRHEVRQGKGFVIRAMFQEVEADYYLLVDGDDTYSPADAHKLLAPLINDRKVHMTVGSRLRRAEKGAFRPLHYLGNRMITGLINKLFSAKLHDVLSGYRGFDREFVKTTPLLSGGFEIETELTLQALDAKRKIEELDIEYKCRPSKSYSKLRTFSDGRLIFSTILGIFKDYKPLSFFGTLSLLCVFLGILTGLPVIREYIQTLIITRLPLTILAASLVLLGMHFMAVGLILHTMARHRRLDQELFILSQGLRADHNKTDRN